MQREYPGLICAVLWPLCPSTDWTTVLCYVHLMVHTLDSDPQCEPSSKASPTQKGSGSHTKDPVLAVLDFTRFTLFWAGQMPAFEGGTVFSAFYRFKVTSRKEKVNREHLNL